MEKTRFTLSTLIIFVLLVICTPTAFASLGNGINLPGLSFGMDCFKQDDGRTTFSSNFATLDQIKNANVYVSRDSDPGSLRGWVSINFGGTVGTPITQKDWENISFSLNCRGVHADNNVSIGAYQQTQWIDETIIYGDWMSAANGSVTLSGVSFLYGNGGYNEYDGGGKGVADSIESSVTQFNAWAQFCVLFANPTVAATYCSMSPIEVSVSSVPEPATLGFLGFGALALIRRRK